jgi:hypothetical protein
VWSEENRERESEREREKIINTDAGEKSLSFCLITQERQRVLTRGGREQKKRIK